MDQVSTCIIARLHAAWCNPDDNSDEIDCLHDELLGQVAGTLDEAILRVVVRVTRDQVETVEVRVDLTNLVLHMTPVGRLVASRYLPQSIFPGGG